MFGLVLGTVGMCVSLSSDKNEIQQLAHSLLWTQPVTAHHVMLFWGKDNFCASKQSELQ